MRLAVDLHIHSCLSPCSDDDMTPNNIVNMASLKGLDIIAITDHNSTGNCRSVIDAGKDLELLIVPGMELCTTEEIHLLCLFPSLESADEFGREVYDTLAPLKNREDIFGSQVLRDRFDIETGHEERLLAVASGMDAETAVARVRALGGAVIPAHINRESYSMLNTLGTIPPEYGFVYLECNKQCNMEAFLKDHPELASGRFIRSSDAHFLWELLERESFLELEEKTIRCLIDTLNGASSAH